MNGLRVLGVRDLPAALEKRDGGSDGLRQLLGPVALERCHFDRDLFGQDRVTSCQPRTPAMESALRYSVLIACGSDATHHGFSDDLRCALSLKNLSHMCSELRPSSPNPSRSKNSKIEIPTTTIRSLLTASVRFRSLLTRVFERFFQRADAPGKRAKPFRRLSPKVAIQFGQFAEMALDELQVAP